MVRKLPSLDPYMQKRTGRGGSQGDMPTREEIDYAFERIHRHQDRLTRDLELEFQEIRASTSTPQVSIISQLNDVSVVNATNNQVLTYVSASAEWIPTSIAELVGVRTSLSQLDDVSVSGAVSGAFFRLEGVTWGPNDPSIDALSDVSTGGAASGEVLRFDGSLWSPASVEGGGSSITSLSQLSDVSVSTAVSGDFFRLIGDTWQGDDVSIGSLDNVSVSTGGSNEVLIRDGAQWTQRAGPGSFYWRAFVSSLNNFPQDVETDIPFDGVLQDGEGNFNGSQGYMVTPIKGLWQWGCWAQIRDPDATMDAVQILSYVGPNLITFQQDNSANESSQSPSITMCVTVDANVTIQMRALAGGNAGTNVSIVPGVSTPRAGFWGYLVRQCD